MVQSSPCLKWGEGVTTGASTDMKPILVAIEITEQVAAQIRFIAESGVFDISTGTATLNFKDGQLLTIKRELFTYAKDM